MSDLDDKILDTLLATLEPPVPPSALTARILAALPDRTQPWHIRLAHLFGSDTLAMPAGSAFAALAFGLMLGYWAMPQQAVETETAELILADAFGTYGWTDIMSETLE